ncbi:MAG TPA: cytochrome P450 [Nocardioides sp.]|uniref:cytochrome P450 family protein n=1 Tax=Nocardioides sp. TaxID=35761 RepID=UPI002C10AC32|nr:cytochrome P450 [Nocardioides sp.]HQR25398.1 cytochrome P450 [Nocardioides sp.]
MTPPRARELDRWGDLDRECPFPLYDEVRASGPVHDVTLADGHRAFLVLGYAAAREALNHPDLSKDMHAALARGGDVVAEGLPGPDFARHMLSVDPPDHTRLRRLAAQAFSRTRLQRLEPRIGEIAASLLDDLAAQGDEPVDLVAGYARPLPFAVLGELLGIDRADQGRLSGWFATMLAPTGGAAPSAEAVAASDRVVGYLTGLVDRRWAEPTEDLVGDLVRACQDGLLTRQELLSTLFQLVVAGHDTTTSLIGNGVAALLAHPDQRDALAADPSRVPRAVEEFLRWDPPVHHATFRYAARDATIAGTVVPAGVQVLVSLAAAGRDPGRNPDPAAFDIDRPGPAHLAFGHGIHHCLGARLARMEAEIAFRALLARFPRLGLAVPREELRWGHGDGLVLRGLSELPVLLRGAQPQETLP